MILAECINTHKRPERQTAMVALELHCYRIDVCCLQETRFSGQGQLREKDFTFYWLGEAKGIRRDAGVAISIANNIAKKLVCLPQTVSDKLIKLRLSQSNTRISSSFAAMLLP